MGTVVSFNAANFVVRYPEFSTVPAPTLQMYFNEATMYLDNSGKGPVQDLNSLTTYLNMLTAHIAAMNGAGVNGQGANGLVGRIDSAGQGSVNVHTTYSSAVAGSMAWYIQTPYGAAYWGATKRYRSFRYRPPVC